MLDTIIWSQLLKLLTVYFSTFILLWSFCSSSFRHSTFPFAVPCCGHHLLFCILPGLASLCLSKPALVQAVSFWLSLMGCLEYPLLCLPHPQELCLQVPVPTRESKKYLLPYDLLHCQVQVCILTGLSGCCSSTDNEVSSSSDCWVNCSGMLDQLASVCSSTFIVGKEMLDKNVEQSETCICTQKLCVMEWSCTNLMSYFGKVLWVSLSRCCITFHERVYITCALLVLV